MDYVFYCVASVALVVILRRAWSFVSGASEAADLSDAILGRRRPASEPGRTVWAWFAEPTQRRRAQRDIFVAGMKVLGMSRGDAALALVPCVRAAMDGKPFGETLNQYVASHFKW